MIALDGTENKKKIGEMLAVSTCAHAGMAAQLPLFIITPHLSHKAAGFRFPLPMMNIVNGGQHALNRCPSGVHGCSKWQDHGRSGMARR